MIPGDPIFPNYWDDTFFIAFGLLEIDINHNMTWCSLLCVLTPDIIRGVVRERIYEKHAAIENHKDGFRVLSE